MSPQYSSLWLKAMITPASERPSPPPDDPPNLPQRRLSVLISGRAFFQAKAAQHGLTPPPPDVVVFSGGSIWLTSPLVSGLARREVVVQRPDDGGWDRLVVLRTLDATRLLCYAPPPSEAVTTTATTTTKQYQRKVRRCHESGCPISTVTVMVDLDVDERPVFLVLTEWECRSSFAREHANTTTYRRRLQIERTLLWSSFGSSSSSSSDDDGGDDSSSSDDDG